MSLPIARARRKNVPSIQRSPYSSTRSHSATESLKPSVVMSQAVCSSPTSHVVLDQPHLGEHAGEVARRGSRRRRPARRRPGSTPRCTRVLPAPRSALGELVDVAAPRGRGSRRSPSARGGGRPTARRTAGRGRTRRCRARSAAGRRARTRRPRSPARRRWSGCRRSRCGRCRGGSGSRCRWTRTLKVPAGSTSRSPGNVSASRGAARGGVRR